MAVSSVLPPAPNTASPKSGFVNFLIEKRTSLVAIPIVTFLGCSLTLGLATLSFPATCIVASTLAIASILIVAFAILERNNVIAEINLKNRKLYSPLALPVLQAIEQAFREGKCVDLSGSLVIIYAQDKLEAFEEIKKEFPILFKKPTDYTHLDFKAILASPPNLGVCALEKKLKSQDFTVINMLRIPNHSSLIDGKMGLNETIVEMLKNRETWTEKFTGQEILPKDFGVPNVHLLGSFSR